MFFGVHAGSNPAKKTFNKFTPPQKKKTALLGGVRFLEYFHEFLGLEHKKILVKLWGKADVLG